jgi:hypothetical protein
MKVFMIALLLLTSANTLFPQKQVKIMCAFADRIECGGTGIACRTFVWRC